MKPDKSYILCTERKKLLKSMQRYNEFNKGITKKMNTIYMNSENSKSSDPQRLLLNLTDQIDLRRKDKYIALSNLIVYYT